MLGQARVTRGSEGQGGSFTPLGRNRKVIAGERCCCHHGSGRLASQSCVGWLEAGRCVFGIPVRYTSGVKFETSWDINVDGTELVKWSEGREFESSLLGLWPPVMYFSVMALTNNPPV